MQRLVIVVTTATLGAALSACGSLPDTDSLFGGGTGAAATTSSGRTGTTGTFAASSSTGVGGSTSTAASSASTSASSSAGGSTSASSSVASSSSSSSASSSSGTPATPVYCDGNACNAGQICCFNPIGPGDHCSNKGNCPSGYAELSCSGPGDCPGGVCCAQYTVMNNTAVYMSVACQATCDQQGTEFVVCSGDPTVCPMQTLCTQSTLLGQGYEICTKM